MAKTEWTKEGVAFERDGSGVPVLFLHGLGFDRRIFQPIRDLARGRFQSVLIDLPGHGESTSPPGPMAHALSAVAEVARVVGASRPVVVGHSASAVAAVRYCAQHPTSGVLLVDQRLFVKPFAELVRQRWPELDSEHFDAAFAPFRESFGLERLSTELRGLAERACQPTREKVVAAWREIAEGSPDELDAQLRAALASVRVPFTSLHGQDPGEAYGQWLRHTMTGATPRLVVWEGASHLPHLFDPARFTELVVQLVQ